MVTEAEWDYLREDRNIALKAIDKYQLTLVYAELTKTRQNSLIKYRKKLLDLPSSYDSPDECYQNFPKKPAWIV